MRLPPQTLAKYLTRLDDLIAEGSAIPIRRGSEAVGGNYLTGETRYRETREVSWPHFAEWRTKCVTTLEQIVSKQSVHRQAVEAFVGLRCEPSKVQFGVAFLTSIRNDLRDGFLTDLSGEIEAEMAADYLVQAERLLADSGEQARYIPTAILAGAVLEKSLRSLCQQLIPPEAVEQTNGKPLALNGLIDALKRRGSINEVTAQQLRAWARIRNSAAHGQFDEFTKEQARAMVDGVRGFLMQYV